MDAPPPYSDSDQSPPQPAPAQPSKADMEAWAETQRTGHNPAPAGPTIGDIASKVTVTENPNSESQKGWWKVGGVKGMKEHVAKHIAGIKEIPDHWQVVIQAEIAAHPAAALAVHAHFMRQNPKKKDGDSSENHGKVLVHIDISPLDGFVGGGS